MKSRFWCVFPVLGLALVTLAGCGAIVAGAAAGAGAVAYMRGELEATEEAPIDQVAEATLQAIDTLEFNLISSDVDGYSGKIVAETARGTEIGISLERESDQVTQIRIRVGVFGDEDLSRLIHEKIRASL